MNLEIAAIVEKIGLNTAIESLRDYCFRRADEAILDGMSGLGWDEMACKLDNIVPLMTDAQLDGDTDD